MRTTTDDGVERRPARGTEPGRGGARGTPCHRGQAARGGWKMPDARWVGRGEGESARQAPAWGDTGAGVAASQPHSEGPVGVTVGAEKGCGTAGAPEQLGP